MVNGNDESIGLGTFCSQTIFSLELIWYFSFAIKLLPQVLHYKLMTPIGLSRLLPETLFSGHEETTYEDKLNQSSVWKYDCKVSELIIIFTQPSFLRWNCDERLGLDRNSTHFLWEKFNLDFTNSYACRTIQNFPPKEEQQLATLIASYMPTTNLTNKPTYIQTHKPSGLPLGDRLPTSLQRMVS